MSLIGQRWRALDPAGKAAWSGSFVPMRKKADRAAWRKKILTPYQLFFRENSAELKAMGSMKQSEVVRVIGDRWRNISPEDKADVTARAAEATVALGAAAEQLAKDAAQAAAANAAHAAMAAANAAAAQAAGAAAASAFPAPAAVVGGAPALPAKPAVPWDAAQALGALRAEEAQTSRDTDTAPKTSEI